MKENLLQILALLLALAWAATARAAIDLRVTEAWPGQPGADLTVARVGP